MRIPTRAVQVFLAASLVLTLASCQAATTPTAAPTKAAAVATSAAATAKPAAATAGSTKAAATAATVQPSSAGFKLTDAAGRTVEMAHLPKRIAVVGKGVYMSLHTVYMFKEARERLVGVENRGNSVSQFIPLIDKSFDRLKVVESNASPEQIATMQPDFIILKGVAPDKMIPGLEQLKIPVMQLGLETPEMLYKDLDNLGKVFGNEQRANDLKAYFSGQIEKIKAGVAKVPEAQQTRMLLMEYNDRSGAIAMQVPAPDWMQTIQAKTAGGVPVWLDAAKGGGWTVVNLEQVATWNAEKVILIISHTMDPDKVLADIKSDPNWAHLKAVANNELYAFPSDIYGWDSPDPRWILGMTWLATKMYPEQFKDIDMKAELYRFFETAYGMDKAAVDSIIVPELHLK